MIDKIIIQNLEVFAKHGAFPEENILGQKFFVSVTLYTNTREAGKSDLLEKSINYSDVSYFIKNFMEEYTFKLLETVAEQLAEKLLLTFSLLEQVELEIKKPWAPIGLPFEMISVHISRAWHTTYIALGSNMGNKKAYLDMAIDMLRKNSCCKVLKIADYIITAPYGVTEQDDFLNSVLKLDTLLTPEELLDELHRIETIAGRERVIQWGPRTLDLDILFYDDLVVDTEKLHIPHIELHKRAFVLTPLVQIAPYLRHPILNKTILELRDDLL